MSSLPVNQPLTYPAKVDWWVAALFGGVLVLQVVFATALFLDGLTAGGIVCVAVAVLVSLLMWGCYHTRYEINAAELIVRLGPFRTTVPLHAIVEVFPTRNPLSAPAPSLDRLEVDYRKDGVPGFLLISPKDKEGFVRDLASAAPQLRNVAEAPLRLKAVSPA